MTVNRKRVLRLMREDNLLCLRRRRFLRTTDSKNSPRIFPNLLPGLSLNGINQLWVADITYIRLRSEFIYLAVILDAFSRRCVGWTLSRFLTTELTLSALRKALRKRKPEPGMVHHSDRGVQYSAHDYVELLNVQGIRISMSRKGNPYDNAQAESFIKTLKYEEVHLFEYRGIADAHKRIRHFLGTVYNRKRLHSAIGYLPPAEFEERINSNTVVKSTNREYVQILNKKEQFSTFPQCNNFFPEKRTLKRKKKSNTKKERKNGLEFNNLA